MATLYDVCKKTGLSTATVSRVLNGSNLVAERTRKRVLAAMEELDYRPNQAAQMLASKRMRTIGVILPEIYDGYYVSILQGLERELSRNKYQMLTTFCNSVDALPELVMSLSGRTDAVVLVGPTLSVAELDRLEMPVRKLVLLGGAIDYPKLSVVQANSEQGAFLVMEHLLKGVDHPRVTVLTGPGNNVDNNMRLAGVKAALNCYGVSEDQVRFMDAGFSQERAQEAMAQVLDDRFDPNVVFALNDEMALGARDILLERGLRIPEDVRLFGFDDTRLGRYFDISTVSVPAKEMGAEAARIALRVGDSDEPLVLSRIFDLQLTVRASSMDSAEQ